MISDFGVMISATVQLMQIEFTIWGITFTFWQALLFNLVAPIVVWVLLEVFLGE